MLYLFYKITFTLLLQLPADIEWHFIGHLQTNKVKLLLGTLSATYKII